MDRYEFAASLLIMCMVCFGFFMHSRGKKRYECSYFATVKEVNCTRVYKGKFGWHSNCRTLLDTGKKMDLSFPVLTGDKIEKCDVIRDHSDEKISDFLDVMKD